MSETTARQTDKCGRTSWWPCDSAEHSREYTVELGQEFGPAGPLAMRVLKDLAQAQRDDGRLRHGFRSLARDLYGPDATEARKIVEYAALIGALDDLVIDDDGRRFTCRISGWQGDSARGREAIRKAQQRDGLVPEKRDKVPAERDVSGSVPLNRAEHRTTTTGDTSTAAVAREAAESGLHIHFHEVLAIAQEAAGKDSNLIVNDAPIDAMLRAYPNADGLRAAREAVADILAGTTRTPHFHKILGWKLKDQPADTAPTVRDERKARADADVQALERLMAESRGARDVA